MIDLKDNKSWVLLWVYTLITVSGLTFGVSALISVIWATNIKDSFVGSWHHSHITWIQRTFLYFLIFAGLIIVFYACLFGVSYLLFEYYKIDLLSREYDSYVISTILIPPGFLFFWTLYRVARGYIGMMRRMEMPV